MRTWLLLVTAVLFVTLFSPVSWSIENPGVRSPIGPSTIPPSSIQSGLVSTPNPIDTTGNLLITGNVRRGMHFRDTVPYGATTSFGSSLGTSSLSSFLRDTSGSEDIGMYFRKYSAQPYYSPTETVTTMMPGRPEIFRPTDTRISTRVQQDTRSEGIGVFGLESLPQEQISSGVGTATTNLGLQGPQTQYGPLAESGLGEVESRSALKDMLRGMSLRSRDAERLVPGQIGIRRQDETLAVEQFQQQVQDVRGKTQESTTVLGLGTGVLGPELQQSLSEEDDSFRYPNRETSIEELKSKFEMQRPAGYDTTSGKQTSTRYQLPTLDEFTPSTDTSRRENRLQQGTDGPGMGGESEKGQEIPAAAEYDNLVKRELGGVKRDTGYTRPDTLDQGQSNVLERIRQQLDDLTRTVENRLKAGQDDVLKAGSTEPAAKRDETRPATRQYTPDLRESLSQGRIDSSDVSNLYEYEEDESGFDEEQLAPEEAGDRLNRADDGKQTHLEFPEIPNWESSQKKSSPLDELNKLSQADLSAEAKRIMGPYRTHESYSEAKFNQQMLAAENYLKAGNYYRAAGCFDLASIYKPDSHQALAGRGHALFAAGEYISSALFLSRALAIKPEYARIKIDLVALLGDENKLAGRMADIEQWLARSGSSKLQLLLSYIYYQTGRLGPAKQAIDAASEKMPQSPAVNAIRTAIDDAIAKQ